MRNFLKITVLTLALSLLCAAFTFASLADEGEDAPASAFTVYDKNGSIAAEGTDFEQLRSIASTLADGDTVVLNADLAASREFFVESTEESPRRIGIDLNGHKIYVPKKIANGLISVGSYTTLDVYSSVAGGVLYCVDTVDTNMGGSVFNVRAKSAVLNVGAFTKDGVTYSGENIATYSAALIDIVTDNNKLEACDENCRFNVNGGSYYSIVSDYSGFIIPRGGKIIMNITDANIISMETKAPINSVGANTVLNLTNCRIIQYQSQPISLFNSALGTVNMKDCISTYAIRSSQSAMGNGVLHLEGRNVFAIPAAGDYSEALIADFGGKTNVTTYADFKLASGDDTLRYYDNTANFSRVLTSEVPKLLYPAMFIDQGDVVKYRFVKSNDSIEQSWSKHEKPAFPYELPIGGEEGVYRYGWQRSLDGDTVVYKMGYIADYNLKIRAVYSGDELYFKLYVPADLIDGDHIDYVNVSIHGESYPAKDWVEETVGGVKYYYAMTGTVYPEFADETITVRIPADYGKGVYVDTTWTLTLSNYIDTVLASEHEGIWSAEQYATVKEIKGAYFPEGAQPEG